MFYIFIVNLDPCPTLWHHPCAYQSVTFHLQNVLMKFLNTFFILSR